MDTQRLLRVRPSYLAAGGLAIFGVCFVLFACLALIWTTSRNAEGDRIATESAAERLTRQATRAVSFVTQPAPTPGVLPTRTPITQQQPTPFPTLAGGEGSINVGGQFGDGEATIIADPNRPSPADAVRNYYTQVSAKRYDLTWPVLSENFKEKFNCCAPNYNFSGYMQWWESVDHVEFGRVETVSQTGDRATVYAEVFYVMKAGTRSPDQQPYVDLVYDTTSGTWLFEDKRAS